MYEGGVRIPLIVRDPSGPRGKVVDTPGTTDDLFPTLLGLAGLVLPAGVDGQDLSGVHSSGVVPERALYWHFPHYHGSGNRPSGAVRIGDYKLVEWFEDGRTELFDLANDLGEGTDISATMPDKTAELRDALHAWREATGARMPMPNPDYSDE